MYSAATVRGMIRGLVIGDTYHFNNQLCRFVKQQLYHKKSPQANRL